MTYFRKFLSKKKLTSVFITLTAIVILILGAGILRESPIIKNSKVIYTICGKIYEIAPANAQTPIPCPPVTGQGAGCCSTWCVSNPCPNSNGDMICQPAC